MDILSGCAEDRLLMGMPAEAKLNIMLNLKSFLRQYVELSLTDGGSNWMHAVVQLGRKPKIGDPI